MVEDIVLLGRFEPEKTRQAASALFRALNCTLMDRAQLLSLLYIADRDSIRETGFPITGDRPVAMDFGPVLSATYGWVAGHEETAAGLWERSFQNVAGEQIRLVTDPGTDSLSPFEVETLGEVADRFGHLTSPQLSELTRGFEEWLKNQPHPGASRPISDRDRLEAVGLGDRADDILAEAEEYHLIDRLLDQTAKQ